ADFIQPTGSIKQNFLYKDGDIYYYVNYTSYTVPINVMDGAYKTFKAAPFIGVNANGNDIIYDETNNRFVQHSFGNFFVSKMPKGSLFNYDDTGMNLVFMTGSAYNGGEIFAILEDKKNKSYHLARIDGATLE